MGAALVMGVGLTGNGRFWRQSIVALAEQALAMVHAALDPVDFDQAFAAGQQMALNEAYATILTSAQILH